MSNVTIEQLKDIMRVAAGEDESIDLNGDILDTPFMDLGYDSLALLETAARLKRDHGVAIADEDLHSLETPRALLDHVNARLAA